MIPHERQPFFARILPDSSRPKSEKRDDGIQYNRCARAQICYTMVYGHTPPFPIAQDDAGGSVVLSLSSVRANGVARGPRTVMVDMVDNRGPAHGQRQSFSELCSRRTMFIVDRSR